ncbi:MAG: hypothetical protein KR126chlam3_00737 [Chlamydiae bacterium]|nr:hypothetical protein [Chlamydiota bacterium]
MSGVESFYLEHLQTNYWGLEALMHKADALHDIETLSKDPKFSQRPNKDAPYFTRWNVVWITLTHPFYSILSIFSAAVALLAYGLYLPNAARVFTILSKHMTRDWEQLCSQWEFKPPLLTPSFNLHQFTSWDLYQHGEVPYDSIIDNMVKPLTYQNKVFEKRVKKAFEAFFEKLVEPPREHSELSDHIPSWFDKLHKKKDQTQSDREQADREQAAKEQADRERRATMEEFLSKCKLSTDEAIVSLRDSLKSKYSDQLDEPINALYRDLKALEQGMRSISSIPLFYDRGNCRGGSLWFIFLYHKTRHLFDDPTKHLMAIARQFSTGMPRQAALLQAFNDSTHLLKLRKTKFPQLTVSLYELDHNLTKAQEKIQSLPIGIYRVGAYHHSLVYVKLSEEKQLVWNPEFGLYPMKGEEMLKMIRKHHYVPGDPDSQIYFHQYESLENPEQEIA